MTYNINGWGIRENPHLLCHCGTTWKSTRGCLESSDQRCAVFAPPCCTRSLIQPPQWWKPKLHKHKTCVEPDAESHQRKSLQIIHQAFLNRQQLFRIYTSFSISQLSQSKSAAISCTKGFWCNFLNEQTRKKKWAWKMVCYRNFHIN